MLYWAFSLTCSTLNFPTTGYYSQVELFNAIQNKVTLNMLIPTWSVNRSELETTCVTSSRGLENPSGACCATSERCQCGFLTSSSSPVWSCVSHPRAWEPVIAFHHCGGNLLRKPTYKPERFAWLIALEVMFRGCLTQLVWICDEETHCGGRKRHQEAKREKQEGTHIPF